MRLPRRIFQFVTVSLCLTVLGCTSAEQMFQSFKELWRLRSQVVETFHLSDVSVNLRNGRHLTVSVVNSPLNRLSKMKQREKARQIAAFVAKSYKPKDTLESVSVVFAAGKSYFIFSYTESSETYRFETAELLAPAKASAPIMQ